MNNRKNDIRISRGYRLKRTTHDLLKNLQLITGEDCDAIIEIACRMYYTDYLQKPETVKKKLNGGIKT